MMKMRVVGKCFGSMDRGYTHPLTRLINSEA
jgi:hypothetical protein